MAIDPYCSISGGEILVFRSYNTSSCASNSVICTRYNSTQCRNASLPAPYPANAPNPIIGFTTYSGKSCISGLEFRREGNMSGVCFSFDNIFFSRTICQSDGVLVWRQWIAGSGNNCVGSPSEERNVSSGCLDFGSYSVMNNCPLSSSTPISSTSLSSFGTIAPTQAATTVAAQAATTVAGQAATTGPTPAATTIAAQAATTSQVATTIRATTRPGDAPNARVSILLLSIVLLLG